MTSDSKDISMLPRTFLERREWFGQFDYVGYHIPLTPIDSPRWHKRKHWLRIQEIFELARVGDFTNCDELLAMNEIFPHGNNIYFTLLGDIATSQTIQKITEKANAVLSETVFPIGDFRDYAEVLESVGRLSDATLFLKAYPRFGRREDCLWFSLSSLLECRWNDILEESPFYTMEYFQKFEGKTQQHIDALASKFGGYSTRVYLGEKYSVVRLAELIIEHSDGSDTNDDFTQIDLRRRFEAATGIDCTPLFDSKGCFQSEAAGIIVEDFLASDYSKTFVEGERYFFGHRIP